MSTKIQMKLIVNWYALCTMDVECEHAVCRQTSETHLRTKLQVNEY